jgi:hypothetical protein
VGVEYPPPQELSPQDRKHPAMVSSKVRPVVRGKGENKLHADNI